GHSKLDGTCQRDGEPARLERPGWIPTLVLDLNLAVVMPHCGTACGRDIQQGRHALAQAHGVDPIPDREELVIPPEVPRATFKAWPRHPVPQGFEAVSCKQDAAAGGAEARELVGGVGAAAGRALKVDQRRDRLVNGWLHREC